VAKEAQQSGDHDEERNDAEHGYQQEQQLYQEGQHDERCQGGDHDEEEGAHALGMLLSSEAGGEADDERCEPADDEQGDEEATCHVPGEHVSDEEGSDEQREPVGAQSGQRSGRPSGLMSAVSVAEQAVQRDGENG